jgi:hypothetical protein
MVDSKFQQKSNAAIQEDFTLDDLSSKNHHGDESCKALN